METILRGGVDLAGANFAGDAHFFEDATTPAKVRSLLDSQKESDKLKGMKLLLAMMSKGRDVPEFFPDVVKNVVVKNIEVKKMVYIYLVHYADFDNSCREIALLSINSFQKDMSGSNQLIRGLALRVMTSIRVSDIIQIQLLAVRKCATDSSPYVRKCAANAVAKIYSLDHEQLQHCQQIIEGLLRDSSTMVLGSAVAAFNEICPFEYELLHQSYRKLCHLLADMDEWTQVITLEVMTRYVRNQFVDPAPGVAVAVRLQAMQRSTAAVQGQISSYIKRRVVKKAFYSDEEDESDEETVEVQHQPLWQQQQQQAEIGSVFTGGDADSEGDLDPDHRLVLKSSLPLLKSRNSGVVLGVCSLHYYCGTQSHQTSQQIGKALVRILRNRREVQYVVLNCINTMARERPLMFRPFLSDFFVKSTDPLFNKLLKLEILTSVSCKDNIQDILKELQTYLRDSNAEVVSTTVRAIGRVADADPGVSRNCMEGVMTLLLGSASEPVIAACVVVLRQLLQQSKSSASGTMILRQLVKLLIVEDGLEEPVARSSVVWLVGEFHNELKAVAPDVLRILAQGFTEESTETKMQIMNLAIKQALQLPDNERVQSLMTYVLEMSRYDVDTDLRDRSRFMTAMMGLAPASDEDATANGSSGNQISLNEDALAELSEHAKGIMLAPKLPPVTLLGAVDVEGLPNFTVGSLSALMGHNISGYNPLSAWPVVQPDATVRDANRAQQSAAAVAAATAAGSGGHVGKSRMPSAFDDESDSGDEDLGIFYSQRRNDADSSSSSSSSEEEEDDEDDSDEESDATDDASDESSAEESSDEDDDDDSEEEERASTVVKPAVKQAQSATVSKTNGVRRITAAGRKKDPFGGAAGDDLLIAVPTVSTATAATVKASSLLDLPVDSFAARSSTTGAPDDLLSTSAVAISSLNFDSTTIPKASSGENLLIPATADRVSSILSSFDASSVGTDNAAVHPGQPQLQMQSVISQPSYPLQQQMQMQQPMQMSMMSAQPMGGMMMAPMGAMNARAMPPGAPQQHLQLQQQQQMLQQQRVPQPAVVENMTDPIDILRPEMGGGLSIKLAYRYGVQAAAYAGAVAAYLVLQNTRDHAIRRIKITFPPELKRTGVQDVPLLAAGEQVTMAVELVLTGLSVKQLKADVRSDKGVFVGVLPINDWHLLQPARLQSTEFEAARSRLGGFSQQSRDFSLAAVAAAGIGSGIDSTACAVSETDLIVFMQRTLNVFLVQGAGLGELMFAGTVRKGLMEQRAFVTVLSDSDKLTLRLNCEDPVLCSSLMDLFIQKLEKRSAPSSSTSL